ncbi:MAG: AAC(3) family N-acetyltransferase [Acidobacteria bacterium]|nr:AAC(3) family N-acetyltransferase [Acidobacteriota bacterium]
MEHLRPSLITDLRTLGVREGDAVMIHASMRAVGPVDGGAAGLIDALDAAVGASGTLMMVLGAYDEWAWVNERPEAERAALLAEATPFDALVAPAETDLGVLAEVFRTHPGTLVSDHPEGRFGVRGRLAPAFVAGVPWDDYYGPGSPLERLVDARGRVLRLGADPNTITLTHYAEYLADVPGKRRVRRTRRVTTPDGPIIRTVDCLDDSDGIVEYAGGDYFTDILRAYDAEGGVRHGRVGNAATELLDAAPYVAFAASWMTAHLAPKY